MKIEGKEESNYEIIKFCSNLLKEGCEQTNFVISHSLFWIITIYLTTMTLSTYLAISFLFEFDDGGALPTKIGTLVGSLFITSTIIYRDSPVSAVSISAVFDLVRFTNSTKQH